MPLIPFRGVLPTLADDVFIAPGAYLIGDVRAAEGANVWFGSVLRADFAEIILERGANIQDNCTLHTDPGEPCSIGAIVLPRARIGSGSIIGANALVTEGTVIPPRSLVLGTPGRIIREVTDEEYEQRCLRTARTYFAHAQEYRRAGISGR